MNNTARRFLLGLVFFAALDTAHAQVSAAISGQVRDITGAIVRDALVTVKSVESGASRTASTGPDGAYRFPSLPLGAQELKVEKQGFQTELRSGITLAVGQEAVFHFELKVGEVSETITIVEQTPVVNISPSPVFGMVGERNIKELPLNGRSYDNLISLNPSAINYTSLKSANTTTSSGASFTVAGRRPQDNIFLVNGIEHTGASQLAVTPGGVSGSMLGIDAVREFNLLTDTYGAEYGKRSGGQVVVVTQSGTNQIHGSAFEFLRNSALDARSVFDQANVPPFRRNQFGGSLGGPIKKDRIFLFGNYEGYRQSLAVRSISVVPDELARQGLLPDASGVYRPVANLDPRMLKYTALWPEPNGPQLLVNGRPTGTRFAYYNPKNSVVEDYGTTRGDVNLTDNDRLSLAYTIDTGSNVLPLPDPLFAADLQLGSHVASVEEVHVFSPNLLNTLRLGFSRAAYNYDSATETRFPQELSFVRGGDPGNIVIGGGAVSSSITTGGGNINAGVWNRRNLFTLTDNVQFNKGIHQLSFGVWLQRVDDNEDIASRRLGSATFNSLTTFLQGQVTNFQILTQHNALSWGSLFGAWYAQDSIRLRPNLTLQIGLRHEFTTGWNEKHNRAANYIPDSNGVLLTEPRLGGSIFTQNRAKRLFGPRVSLAWDVFGDGKTAIRAGFGTFYTLIDAPSFLLSALPPYNGSAAFSGSLPDMLPIDLNAPIDPSCGPDVTGPCVRYAPQGLQADAHTPTVQSWSFSIQRQLDRDTALRVAYVGSHGYHGLLNIDPNTIPATTCTNPAGCLAGGLGTGRSTVSQGQRYIPVTPTRPNPYVAQAFFWNTAGNSSYNALQLDLTRRMTSGLQFRAAYTWSKNLDMNSGLTGAQAQNQAQMIMDRTDLRRDWGPSALNVTHQASFAVTYELPFRDSNTVRGHLLGGWQMNTITALQSGFPFTPLAGSNRLGDGNTRNPDRPNLNPAFSGPVILGKQGQWFDPNAFLLPAPGTFGNLGRGAFNGPGLANMDLSLFKNIRLSERYRLQFRAEFFNALNRVNLGTPNAAVFSGTAINPSAGLITSLATTPRQLQFGLKLLF